MNHPEYRLAVEPLKIGIIIIKKVKDVGIEKPWPHLTKTGV
jgi:hypothetical protein